MTHRVNVASLNYEMNCISHRIYSMKIENESFLYGKYLCILSIYSNNMPEFSICTDSYHHQWLNDRENEWENEGMREEEEDDTRL